MGDRAERAERVERVEIDALLIGALYGELTAADEARLTAHLESHPADRTALADLTRTREAVRSSRILSVQLEPPQAVSALLMQEAARRLPRVEREAGWLLRLTRMLLVHPAMAVAAMLVVVVGVAGVVHLRRGDQFAEVRAPAATDPAFEAGASRPAVVTPLASGAPAQEPTGATDSGSAQADTPALQPNATAVGRYQVDLAAASEQERSSDDLSSTDRPGRAQRAPLTEASKERAVAKQEAPRTPSGLYVQRPEPMPKDLDESPRLAKPDVGYLRDEQAKKRARATEPGAAGGGAATAAPSAPAPATPAETPTSTPKAQVGFDGARDDIAKRKAPARPSASTREAQAPPSSAVAASPPASGPAAAPPAAAPALAPPPPPARIEAPSQRENRKFAQKPVPAPDGKAADEKVSEEKTLLGWARKQHDQVIALVKSSNCVAAANVATEIYTRAPDYYAANVATDRSVKPCVVYLNREREREDRSRAASKRALSNDAPATPKRPSSNDAPAPAPAPSKK